MKKHNIYNLVLAFLLLFIGVGCQDFLTEESVTDITADSYISNEVGHEALVKSCYPAYREIINQYRLALSGTDIFQASGWNDKVVGEGPVFDQYDAARFNSSMGELASFWDLLYQEIGRTNSAVERAEGIEYSDPTKKAARVSEAKFLRALSYFYLVQTWGDVPMPLVETITPDKNVIKIPAAEVYTQILKDLTEAEAALPATPSDYGRVTKGAAQFLLSRVYLTRGWNFNNSLGGSAADYTAALGWADKVITAYPLVPQYNTLFPKRTTNPLTQYTGGQNAVNSEVVFAVQFNKDVLTNANEISSQPGNHYHSIFPGNGELVGNSGRSPDYNRHLNKNIPTIASYRLFDPQQDSRYMHNFLDVIYALIDVNDYAYSYDDDNLKVSYAKGDTVAFWRPWNNPASGADLGIDQGGTKNYAVMNLEDQINGTPISRLKAGAPSMWKFWEPNIEYGDGYGTFDFALFRSSEAYLIAAEAIVKGASGGALGSAENYYNKVIDRAVGVGVDPMCAKYPEDHTSMEAVSYRATSSNMSVDLILDERARELMGEFNRWFDLKRTGKLIERTEKMNLWTKNNGSLDAHHLLRPIPQHEIDRSAPSIDNNPGY